MPRFRAKKKPTALLRVGWAGYDVIYDSLTLRLRAQRPGVHLPHEVAIAWTANLAGTEGIEPSVGGLTVRCLAAWLHAKTWWSWRELNPRHQRCKRCVLPLNYNPTGLKGMTPNTENFQVF